MKQIKTQADLAINGAPPAFEQTLHVGRPNIGSKESFLNYVDQIFDSRWLSNNGPFVQEFENKVATLHDVKHCIAMCNGTVALEIAIRSLDLTGDVILPSYTFIATAHALHWQGITPVFADINPHTHCIDPESVRKLITPNTTGIIGVHLWGHAASIDDLQKIANEYELKLMFDAAHAFGCSYKGRKIGNFGSCEVLSFHATKFFNTFEGGAVLTNDDGLAEKIRLMRNFGFAGLDNVTYPGTNGKMTEVSAAMGLVNFENINDIIQINLTNYKTYQQQLASLAGINIYAFNDNEDNNYQYVVMQIAEECPVTRDEIIDVLHAENILARKYFWPGCHNMRPYKQLFPDASQNLPNTKQVADNVVVLPTGSSLSQNEIGIICQVIRTLVETSSRK